MRGRPQRLAWQEGLGEPQALARRGAKEPAQLWGSGVAGWGLWGRDTPRSHLVLLQLLLYHVVPVLQGLLQPPEAWVGEELGQRVRECGRWRGSLLPQPLALPGPRESGSTSSP